MSRNRKAFGYLILLIFIAWATFPWIAPSYSHNLVLSIQLLPGKIPTYEVRLLDLTPWPATLTDATWMVTHHGLYNYWAPSEPPKQTLVLLPLQSHVFHFTIYNGTATTVSNYYNGSLIVELRATIQILGNSSPIHLQSSYNSSSS